MIMYNNVWAGRKNKNSILNEFDQSQSVCSAGWGRGACPYTRGRLEARVGHAETDVVFGCACASSRRWAEREARVTRLGSRLWQGIRQGGPST